MPTVLVVEDVEDIREMVSEIVRGEGFDVLEAENGEQALRALDGAAEEPCLVLLDLMMPVMDGAEFLSVLQSTGRLAGLPVVVMSATGQPADVPSATRFLRKPTGEDTLKKVVREFCERHH